MQDVPRNPLTANYSVHVYAGDDMEVMSGANQGDPLLTAEEVCLGDVYELLPEASNYELKIHDAGTGSGFMNSSDRPLFVAIGSEIGQGGEALSLRGRLTFMAPDGDKLDLIMIGLRPASGREHLFFLPLAPIEPKISYTLLDASDDAGSVALHDISPVAFARGTMITMASGEQCAVEALTIGDRVLTREGPRELRWIGQRTVRAVGEHAPVVISKGAMANEADLIVSQHQRLFIYQRGERRLGQTAEVLVKARDIVDGDRVFIRSGGFVDYFHLLFDEHEIIYAECIPTESLLYSERDTGRLPTELHNEVASHLPELQHRPHYGTEADKAILSQMGPDGLRRAARGT